MARSSAPRAASGLASLTVPTLVRHLGVAVLAGVVLLIASNTIGDYRDYQLANVAVYVVAVAGLTLLIGLSGQISIGNGAFMAVGGYLAALLLADLKWPLIAILPVATVGAAVAGAIFGVAAARLRGPYLAGATLMLAVALPSVATRFQSVLGGDQGLGFFIGVPGFVGPNVSPYRWLAWVTCAAALVTMVLLANLIRSRTGRSWRAVRDDEIAAALAGLNVARLQILAFIVSAACAGLGGTLLAMWNQSVSPGLFSLTLSIQLLTASVLGGLGSLTGAVLGSAIVVLPYTYLQNQAISLGMTTATGSNVPILAYGAVLIVVMLVFPAGIQGLLSWLVRATRIRQAARLLTGPLARRSGPAAGRSGPAAGRSGPAAGRSGPAADVPGQPHVVADSPPMVPDPSPGVPGASPGSSVHSAASGHPDQRTQQAADPQEKGTT